MDADWDEASLSFLHPGEKEGNMGDVEIECAIRVRAGKEWARVPRGRGLVVVDLELRLHDPGLRFTLYQP
jgi:hypothetical protein